jgi:hypothetical protein
MAVADVAAHDVAPWTRSGALGANVVHGSVFKIVFSPIFQTKLSI